MTTKLKSILIDAGIVIAIALVSIYVIHHINFLKGFFTGEQKQEIPVELSPEYKKLEADFNKRNIKLAIDSVMLRADSLRLQDKDIQLATVLDGLKDVQPKFIIQREKIKGYTIAERNTAYDLEVAEQNGEMK